MTVASTARLATDTGHLVLASESRSVADRGSGRTAVHRIIRTTAGGPDPECATGINSFVGILFAGRGDGWVAWRRQCEEALVAGRAVGQLRRLARHVADRVYTQRLS